jgi:hypothetical protein
VDKKNYILGYHLVAFLDVLGQREKFRKLELPETPEDYARVEQVLKDTAGFVSQLRDMFREQFEAFEDGFSSGRLQIKDSVRPNFVGFSDSFVASVVLRNDGGDLVPIIKIFSALSAASILMLTSLASKHALRGGVDVGLATEMGSEEIYGTALESAYLLESQRAKYPRILIGSQLQKYLAVALVKFENDTTPSAKGAKAVVQKLMRLISTDADGESILDYLGPVLPKPEEAKNTVQSAYDFIVAEHQRSRFKGDSKLIDRYGLLRVYFESRLPSWGLTASNR